MIDLLSVVALGFLGSFGHCVGMCGPLTVAFSLSQPDKSQKFSGLRCHLLLNSGRIISYALVGAALGGLSSILIAGGQLAGIGSSLRQAITIFTGVLLIWLGLRQIKPNWLPQMPFLHPIKGKLHERLNSRMMKLAVRETWWTPALLGGVWGLIPCGFLYTAQLKAVETSNLWLGALTMLSFGLGTMPTMLGVGVSASRLSVDKRGQLFRMGGWITLAIGILTLLRTDAMIDYTGHGALILLMLALVARPLSSFYAAPLRYRRGIGVASFILALAHTGHMLEHSLNWNTQAIAFMLPQHQIGIIVGILALLLMFPAAVTSNDRFQQSLGKYWRRIHLLTVPALVLAVAHTILSGSHYLGELQLTDAHRLRTVVIGVLCISVLTMRSPLFKKRII
ncbi:urease accessory protein UreH domain-containing protein [Myxosarcina sp. GI1(2024)]